jgi:hypothetical protein
VELTLKALISITALALATLCGCDFAVSNDPPSAIVTKAQSAGAGDLSPAVSLESMSQWLARNPDPARQFEALCAAARVNASASWGDTTEGRLCRASSQVWFFRAPEQPITGDSRVFWPGRR